MWAGHLGAASLFAIVTAACLTVVLFLALRAAVHGSCRDGVAIRIHVAGSRGKSSTVRLVAAGLRRGGLRVLAKTTGTVPVLIAPDGAEEAWRRRGPATIGEQIAFFRRAAREHVDAVVLECMAVRPDLVWAERHLVRPTIVVLTNARPDHLEEMQGDPARIAESLAATVPPRGRLIVSDEAIQAAPIARCSHRRDADVEVVATTDLPPFEANRRLALAACGAAGVPLEVAAAGLDDARPDRGAFKIVEVSAPGGTRFRLANAFACNDVDSFRRLWSTYRMPEERRSVVLLNARADRPLRSRDFLRTLIELDPSMCLFLSGGGWPLRRLAVRAGFAASQLRVLPERRPRDAIAALAEVAGAGGLVWGVGNYRGLGAAIVEVAQGEAPRC
jgi:poly-gamma-glutamate synthase PgsB/CapB